MASSKNTSTALRVLIVLAIILIVVQAVLWLTREEPLSIQEIHEQIVVEQSSLPERRREQLRVQLAVTDYMQKEGNPPRRLEDLVPIYFDRVPLDPDTGKAFDYEVDGIRFIVGAAEIDGKVAEKRAESKTKGTAGLFGDLSKEEEALISSLDEPIDIAYLYDPAGKRDPFTPFNFGSRIDDSSDKPPLERFEIGQLRLTAVLKGFDEPIAIIEDGTGTGHTAQEGTKVGLNGGEIIEILPDRALILEKQVDFTGKEETRTIEMRLRAPAEEVSRDRVRR